MATKRSEVVTLEGLAASLDKAFAIASKRHGAVFEPGTLALNWEIFGRRIKSLEKDGASRLDLANTVIASAKLKGVQPAVIGLGKWTLVGYWDPDIGPIGPIGPLR
jgi:hypothetical protein